MFEDNNDPIVVVVEQGIYLCYSQQEDPTLRDAYLMGYLMGMGGVAEGTEDGTYHFNLEVVETSLVATLEPIQN